MLSQAHRRSIHTSLVPILGEEETSALLDQFPASPSDAPATRADLDTLRVEVHADLDSLRGEVRADLKTLRNEVHADLKTLRNEVHADLTTLRGEVHADLVEHRAESRADLAEFRAEVHAMHAQLTRWLVTSILGALFGAVSVAAAINAVFR